MKSANLAIVFTDIQGFTERTSRQTREENQRLLATHDALLRPIFAGFGGRIVKSIGDAFLVTFESPTQAVLAGVAIQDRLWMHNRGIEEAEQLHVRVAVNVGEVRVESGDVFGEPVNIAARVEAITEPGEVYFTEAVHLSMNKAEVPAEEVGHFELKGIPGRIRVFRVPHAPYRVQPAPSTSEAEALDGAQPPFGNMGLSRLPESSGAAQAISQAIRGRRVRPGVVLGVLAAGLVLAALVALFGSSRIERAIDAARDASAQERPQRIREAEALIAQVKDEPERAFRRGQLTIAVGRGEEAARRFTEAASAGSEDALDALVELLEHAKCDVRSEAARGLGQLGAEDANVAKRVRRPLERLSEKGGPGDPQERNRALLRGIFGCNSKEAAVRALERLG